MAPRSFRLAFLTVAIGAAFGGGILYAQPGGDTKPADPTATPPAPAPTPAPAPAPAGDKELPDLTLPGEKKVDLSPREMSTRADELIKEMEATHRSVLEMQAAAKQAKDVIKLNCVNENLLAVKQLLNIADAAENELDEAIARGDRAEQVHQFGQITIASEKSAGARDEAQACIGEELHFVGKNDLTVDGPAIRNDPTDDGDLGEPGGEDPFDTAVTLEDPAFASPFMPL